MYRKQALLAFAIGLASQQYYKVVDKRPWLIFTVIVFFIILGMGFFDNYVIDQSSPLSNINISNNDNQLRCVLRQSISKYAMNMKSFIRSYLDNHPDKNLHNQLLKENSKEIGDIINKYNPIGSDITKVLLKRIDIEIEVIHALFANNPKYAKKTIDSLNKNSKEFALVLNKINSDKLSLNDLQPIFKNFDEKFIQMTLARIEENWLRDLQLWSSYYEEQMKFADMLVHTLVN